MKLAALGAATIALGAVLTEPGLLAIGALWVVLGLLVRQNAETLKGLKGKSGEPKVDGRTFALGTLLWFSLGMPSLLVGLLQLGISDEHADWRWLPIVVGGLALGIGGVGGLLYLLGSAVGAKTGPPPAVPAVLRIRSVKETGTFINERPRLELELLVEPEPASGLAPYEVTKLATVPFTALGSLGVGDGFRALVVGPDHPTGMDIHWDQPLASDDVAARLAELDRLLEAGQVSDAEHRAQRERILGSL